MKKSNQIVVNANGGRKSGIAKWRLEAIAVCAIVACGLPMKSFAVSDADATTAYNAFNSNFLNAAGNGYEASLGSTSYLYFWQQAEAIELAIDRYERNHSSVEVNRISALANKLVASYSDAWISSNQWNDDLGRVSECLARAYLVTGTASVLTKAKYCFNTAYQRGWSTTTGGGIWEKMDDLSRGKEMLSTGNCGYAAGLIYMGNGSQGYRNHAGNIYAWIRGHLFNPSTGQVYTSEYQNGTTNTASQVYNQGTMVDYARLLYKINSSNANYLNDARWAVVYTKANHTDGNGFISSCAAQFSRGLGHLVVDNNLWNSTFSSGTSYYSWMYDNCNTGWGHRWTLHNISWNRIASQTPTDTNRDPTQYEGIPSLMLYTFTPH